MLPQPDDGTLFFAVLTGIGWLAWAGFSFSVLVEIIALARRRSAPRIRGLGGLQSLASLLIGGIVLLIPTAASAATSTPAVAATAPHSMGENNADATTGTKTPAPPAETSTRRHTVATSTELPWDLAEEYLGDGTRWKDIAALNNIPQLTAGDQYLPQGATIALPANAHPRTTHTAQTRKSPAAPPQQQTGRQSSDVENELQRLDAASLTELAGAYRQSSKPPADATGAWGHIPPETIPPARPSTACYCRARPGTTRHCPARPGPRLG